MKRFLALLLCLCMLIPTALADDVDQLLRNAEDFIDAGDLPHAAACMELFERCNVTDADLYVEAAALYYNMGNADSALHAINQALAINPLHTDAWFARGVLAYNTQDYAAYQQAILYLEALRAPEGALASLRDLHQSAIAPRNEALDALFAAGSVSLTETNLFLGATDDLTGAMAMSVSPDGQRVIVLLDQQWYIWDRIALTLSPLTHDTTRGVQSEGDLLDDMFLQRPQPSFALYTPSSGRRTDALLCRSTVPAPTGWKTT